MWCAHCAERADGPATGGGLPPAGPGSGADRRGPRRPGRPRARGAWSERSGPRPHPARRFPHRGWPWSERPRRPDGPNPPPPFRGPVFPDLRGQRESGPWCGCARSSSRAPAGSAHGSDPPRPGGNCPPGRTAGSGPGGSRSCARRDGAARAGRPAGPDPPVRRRAVRAGGPVFPGARPTGVRRFRGPAGRGPGAPDRLRENFRSPGSGVPAGHRPCAIRPIAARRPDGAPAGGAPLPIRFYGGAGRPRPFFYARAPRPGRQSPRIPRPRPRFCRAALPVDGWPR